MLSTDQAAGSSALGLTAADVAARVSRQQTNVYRRPSSRSTADIVRANVFNRFNAILGALLVVILVVGPLADALFGFVIVINTAVGIVQEWRAKKALDDLSILNEARPRAWRDGVLVELHPDELVLDDIVDLGPGDQLLVDGTVLVSNGLEVDEALLTGESDAVRKGADSKVLSGSFVVSGAGRYVATAVGADAYAARLGAAASEYRKSSSQLRTDINRILLWVTWLFPPIALITIYGQVRGNQRTSDVVRGVVASLVALVPEGLVLLTSIAFAVGVLRLSRRRCLVQDLAAIEMLARVDRVCTDKTGTLTESGMRVRETRPVAATDVAVTAVLGAMAAVDPHPNASMGAIGQSYPVAPNWEVERWVPFSSRTRWSGAAFVGHGCWVLGAPEALTSTTSESAVAAAEISRAGYRVLMLARNDGPLTEELDQSTIHPIALVVMEQRVRPDAAATLSFFADQQVEVIVLSGDSPASVGAVAHALALPGAEETVDARHLPTDGPGMAALIDRARVFGRVGPEDKLRIVKSLRARGHTVAMTGDGVNDVLALKEADVGVAMGDGSAAARAVARIVLLDNAFATLPQVVAEGRRVIGNINRVATLFLVKTTYAALLAVAVGVARFPFPFLPRHLTLIGTLTIGVPAFFLALAPNHERAETDLIRRALRLAVPIGFLAAAATLGAYIAVRELTDATLAQERTAATVTLFTVTLAALGVVARPARGWRLGLVGAMGAMFVLALVLPLSRHFFSLPLPPFDAWWSVCWISAVCAALVVVVGKSARAIPCATNSRDRC